MLRTDIVAKVPKDVRAELMIFTEDQKMTILSEPDANGFRTIVVNNGQKVRGVLWGSLDEAILQERGYCFQHSSEFEMSCQPEVKIGRKLTIMVPDPNDPQLKYIMNSGKPVTSIYVKRK